MTDSLTSAICLPIILIQYVKATERICQRCVENSRDCKWRTANTIRPERATFLRKRFRNTFTANFLSGSAGAAGTRRVSIAG